MFRHKYLLLEKNQKQTKTIIFNTKIIGKIDFFPTEIPRVIKVGDHDFVLSLAVSFLIISTFPPICLERWFLLFPQKLSLLDISHSTHQSLTVKVISNSAEFLVIPKA